MSPVLDISWIHTRVMQYQSREIAVRVAPRRAAVALILRKTSESNSPVEILLIGRALNRHDPWSGHMAFPGGRVEPTDQSFLHTAYREVQEEVGINLEVDGEYFGKLDDLQASARGRVLPMAITPYVFRLIRPVLASLSDEVAEVIWIPLEDLLNPGAASTVPYEMEGKRFDLPCVNIKGHIIWGLTYQMLMSFFAILNRGD